MISTTTSSCSTKSMEDVWKDISLASLSRNASDNTTTSTHHPTAAAFRGIMFQDFLASTSTTSSNIDPPPPAAATTVLRLNCGTRSDLQQHLLETTSTTITGPPLLKPNSITGPTSTSVTTTTRPNSLNNPSSVFPSCCKKRALDDHDQNREDHHNSTNGGRHKRMMKNRESAARSRARKQAYINELELEIARLREENARLKRRLQAKTKINSVCFSFPFSVDYHSYI
ncbi:bZIP transcription factor 27-like isoform X1 [Pyrus x bretschneideri]|uniref:bZIP transcription factor 27-like isoform X1 n=1 Tax=Pyrus x bretschneideri TaxID=225117 RepID=UPI00202FC812|nr:bZIP transcription factor 27-like isoform X1 [Pyrus x bretschneideri]